jgi:hypothetical protein
MRIVTFLRRPQLGIVALAGLVVLLIAGAFSVAHAQAPICRDVSNLTICGDTLVVESGTQFHLRGNIKIGPKGAAAVVHVTDMDTSFAGIEIDPGTYTAQFFHLDAVDPNSGAKDLLFGKVRFIKDTNSTPLLATHYVHDPDNPGNSVVAGRLFVDPTAKKIFLPAAGAVPIFNQKNIERNSNILFPYMDRAALRPFYANGGTVGEFATINAEFDLTAKKFTAVMPLKLKLTANADNPNLQVTLNAIFSETGVFSGNATAFKVVLGGLLVSVDNITLKVGEFTAAKASVSKIDNPDLPQLDPTNANLLFEFQDLKYKDGKFTIGGVTTPIKDWVFGDSFKMTNQTLGITNDAAAQTTFLTFNSKLVFGAVTADATQVPITAKFSRKVINGVG